MCEKNNKKKTALIFTYIFLIICQMACLASSAEAAGILSGAQLSGMFSIFKDMTNFYIKIAYGLIVILFAIGAVKSGLSAQFSKQFGLSGHLSQYMSDFIVSVAIFIFGILTYPIVEAIVNRVVSITKGSVTGLTL